MAITNHERVGKALELLKTGLVPFIERELKAKYGNDWAFEVRDILSDTRLGAGKSESLQDVAASLVVMDRKWGDVFRQILGKTERSLVNELLAVRNSWAHQETFSSDDAYRALDSAEVGLVVVQGVDRTAQQVHRVDRLIPDVGGRRSGIPQHVFVLLQLRPVWLDLLKRLRHAFHGGHHVLRELADIDHGDPTSLCGRHHHRAGREGHRQENFSG